MKNLDLSGVDPLRWAEIRARVEAVESYLGIEHPTEADRIEHAGQVGLGQTQFLGLVRAWRAHGTAVALAGAKRQRAPRTQWRSLPAQTEKIMTDTLGRLGPDARLAQAVKVVNEALSAAGSTPVSKQTIWRRLMAIRGARGSAAGAGDVVIARTRVALPTIIDGKITLPPLVLAADPTDGRIIASAIAVDESSLASIVDALRTVDSTAVVIAEDSLREAFSKLQIDLRVVSPTSARRTLARVLGRQLGPLNLLYAAVAEGAEKRLTAKSDKALDLEDAAVVIADAIRKHNSQRAAESRSDEAGERQGDS